MTIPQLSENLPLCARENILRESYNKPFKNIISFKISLDQNVNKKDQIQI